MKKILFLLIIIGLSFKLLCQSQINNSNGYPLNKFSKKDILDRICTYILSGSVLDINLGLYDYPNSRRIYTNHLIKRRNSCNIGNISINTLNLSIRFHYTGTMGIGGFAPNKRLTIYFQSLS